MEDKFRESNEHRQRLKILEHHIGEYYYMIGNIHLAISNAMEHYHQSKLENNTGLGRDIGLVCDCEPHTYYEWEKEENKCSQCNKQLICNECGDGSGWYGNDIPPEYGSITMNCSKCNPDAN